MPSVRRILAINTANAGGGAEKIAYNLTRELHLRGFHSKLMAHRIDYTADALASRIVIPVPGDNTLYSVGNFLDELFATQYLFYLPTWKVPLMEETQQADIVHLHNMHGYYFNLLTIPFLMWEKPVVWTMHDMWPFTGKCSHSFDCDRFIHACGQCPLLSTYPRLSRDTSRFHLLLKKSLFTRSRFAVVSPSEWMRTRIERSFLRDKPVYVVPSAVDRTVFFPEQKSLARARLGVPEGKKVLAFVASWVNSIPSKGVAIFKSMLHSLNNERDDIFALVIGHLEGQSVLGDEFDGVETGWVGNQGLMRGYYAAADVFVSPTLAENSSCTIVEAMACGTPPVAFSVGGVSEQVKSGETGILVESGNDAGLIDAVRFMLSSDERRQLMGGAAVERVAHHFDIDQCVNAHLAIYEQVKRFKDSATER
jgi:glycosyltransferase involved in cell wall biosynthesis